MKNVSLNDRAQQLLKTLVELYIRDGQPVGSRTLSKDSSLELSPATIRNVMADLEEMGLIVAPHTSAGRIPTVQGYRLFVDSLLTVKPLDLKQVHRLEQKFSVIADPQTVIRSASSLLSDFSSMAGVVMMPRREHKALRQVEFLPLSNNRVLAILVINEKEVQNRIIDTARHYTPSELQQAANYLNSMFAGKDLEAVRQTLVREMQEAKHSMDRLMSDAISMAQQAFHEDEAGNDYLLAGQTNLMSYADMADMDKLRQLFEAFTRKQDILGLLDQSLQAQGVQIFIGEESGYQALDSCSVVTAPYQVDGQILGVLGVIGPKRMAYDRVIPLVDVTAKLLGSALNLNK